MNKIQAVLAGAVLITAGGLCAGNANASKDLSKNQKQIQEAVMPTGLNVDEFVSKTVKRVAKNLK